MSKVSFLLYNSFYDPIKEMSLEQKGMLFDAVFQWHINGTIPDLPPEAMIAFKFMLSNFERDSKRYDVICQRNRDNIEKRWLKEKNSLPNDTKNTTGKNGIPDDTKNTDNDNDNDNDNDLKEESIKKKKPRFSPPSLSDIQNYFSDLAHKKGLNINSSLEAEKYESFYTSKGWYIGKNKMVDWKAAVRNWMKNVKPTNGHSFEPLTREKSLM